MKKSSILTVLIIVSLLVVVLGGCDSSTSKTVYELETPRINGDFDVDHNHIYWEKVEDADYYVIYGQQFKYDPKNPRGLDASIPRDKKKYQKIAESRVAGELEYIHHTIYDWVYSVRAFTDDGLASDYSVAIFTEYWAE